ncbi:MAG: MerR family transcriptional regulator [Acidimicrobiales bacterium]
MDQVGFRGPQVCGIVGITYRQLDYWDRTGLSRPSLAQARGSGSQRLYAYKDLLELKVIKQLLDGGVNLRQARRAIECLRDSVGEDLTTANLVLVGEGSVLLRTGEEIIDLLRGGQGVFNVVPLAGVVGEVDAAIHRIDSAHMATGASGPADLQAPASDAAAAGSSGLARLAEGG